MQRKVHLLIMNNISGEWLIMERNGRMYIDVFLFLIKKNEVGINLPQMDYEVNSYTISKRHWPKAKYMRAFMYHGVNRSSFHWSRISSAIC